MREFDSFRGSVAATIVVLHVIPNYFPATRWGGPIFSTKAICDALASAQGIRISVVTTDAAGPSLSDTIPLTERRVWMPAGYEVLYYRRMLRYSISPGLLMALPGAIQRADVVHITSTYSFPVLPALALARLFRRPVVWSPRGAIQASQEWHAAPRQMPKRVFEAVARWLAPQDTVLHVTALSEAAATVQRMEGMRTVVIPNSVEIPDQTALAGRDWRRDGLLRLLFLSRVHEKKGIENLLGAMAKMPAAVVLDIYGTGDVDYLAHLTRKVLALGLDTRVRFHGHVSGQAKTAAFRSADLFILPSYSENFGMAIAEALAHGVPVIATDKTPWNRLADKGCGATVSVGVEPLREAIVRLADEDLAAMGARGRNWMAHEFSSVSTNADMLSLYRELVATRRERMAA